MGAWVVPALLAVPRAGDAFDDEGDLKDPPMREQLEALVAKLIFHAAANREKGA